MVSTTRVTMRQRAMNLLGRREHSRSELKGKLKFRAKSEEELDALLDELVAKDLLSDLRYARMIVSTRSERYGDAHLRSNLRLAGVSPEIIEKVMDECENERSRLMTLWKTKFSTMPADEKEFLQQSRFLMQRGFTSSLVRECLGPHFPKKRVRPEE